MRGTALCLITAAVLSCAEAEDQVDEAIEEIDEATGVDTLESEAALPPHRVVIQAASYAYEPSQITVPHGAVRFIIANGSDIAHGFEVEGQGIEEEISEIPAGSSDSLTVEFHQPGEYVIYCPVGDHRQRGMTGTLTVSP